VAPGSYAVDLDIVFRSSVEFLDTKDFVYNIANGVAGDLNVSAGMAGDDSTAHSFAAKYEPAARTIIQSIGRAGMGMATISGRLLTMAVAYLKLEDSLAMAFGKIDTSTGTAPSNPQCEENEAYNSLPMVTGSKEVHEIPVIGKFWPQGNPDKLRQTAEIWAKCATLIDDAQYNATRHAASVVEHCSGEGFEGFQRYAATVYTGHPSGGTETSDSLPLMENLSASCRLMHNVCNEYADAIDTCRNTLIALGVAAGIITTAGVLLTFFTFGGSDAAAAAADAALAADAAVAAETLAAAEATAASAAAVAEAEAIVARLAASLVLTVGTVAAVTAGSTTEASAAPSMPPAGPVALPAGDPIPPPVPPPYPLYSPAEQAAAQTWAQGLPGRPPNYGTPADRAYQQRVAGAPERQMSGANGPVWADGFRPSDGAIIDAKNVRKPGCSPRSLQGLQEEAFNTNLLLDGDESELSRYQGAIGNPANHAQYLEIDTPDPSTVGYWEFIAARNHVKHNVRYVP
jgi:hypothetical protein